MKFTSIFFTASEAIFENTSNIAISERESSLSEWVKIHFYTQRAQTTSAKPNMKFTSIFFTASEAIFEIILKYNIFDPIYKSMKTALPFQSPILKRHPGSLPQTIACRATQLLFNTNQLIILGCTVTTAH